MTIGFIYKECMYWVSQIQSIRNEMERIKAELRDKAKSKNEAYSAYGFSGDIASLSKNLDVTEAILLASLNNGTTYWAGNNQTYDTPKIAPCKNELFDRMRDIYDAHIELHRSVINFLSGQMVYN